MGVFFGDSTPLGKKGNWIQGFRGISRDPRTGTQPRLMKVLLLIHILENIVTYYTSSVVILLLSPNSKFPRKKLWLVQVTLSACLSSNQPWPEVPGYTNKDAELLKRVPRSFVNWTDTQRVPTGLLKHTKSGIKHLPGETCVCRVCFCFVSLVGSSMSLSYFFLSEPLKGICSHILSARGQAAWWFPFEVYVPQQMDPKK